MSEKKESNSVELIKPDDFITSKLEVIIKNAYDPASPPESSGVSRSEFMNQVMPIKNMKPGSGDKHRDKVRLIPNEDDAHILLADVMLYGGFDISSNSIVYPPMSTMPWHTNSNNKGTRTYYTYTESEGLFRWVDPNTGITHTDVDNIGWTCRSFYIREVEPFLWHTIWSEGVRFAFGFNTHNKD